MSWAHRVSPGFHRGANMVKLGGCMVFKAENPLEWSTLSGFHVPMSSSEQGEGFPIWPRGVNYGGHTYGSTTKYVSRKTKTAGIP